MDEQQTPIECRGAPKEQLGAARARVPYWDVVKALLIILVMLGHSIQYGVGGNFWGMW